MSNQLEPGDLAIIIRSIDNLSVGKIVECVQIDAVGHPKFGTVWLVKSTGSDLVTMFGGVGDNAHVPQDWLKKIPKDALPDEEEVKELEYVRV